MHKYFIKTPWWARAFFSSYVWRMPTKEKTVYLSFDDGPHPTITPWVLNELKKFSAKATFFCIGNNVVQHRSVYERVVAEGHAIGNHTFHHLNGWKTSDKTYLADVAKAADVMSTNLFRPPYGKIKKEQAEALKHGVNGTQHNIIMWDVLSADFDTSISPGQCTRNVLKNVRSGSIVVFHDSEKAFTNLKKTLPEVLSALQNEGYRFEEIKMEWL
ncbi:MAG TPA: polysaccharide deacetylase family protein [Flavisolibacter sp.]|jgi:peptidoglycan/xylan/chitin deacetylase (PgdA/CDA1 family)